MDTRDRRARLLAQDALNGIDYVEVVDHGQRHLRVHFLKDRPDEARLREEIVAATITGGDAIPVVAVQPIRSGDWGHDTANRPTLDLRVDVPGDFSMYVLTLLHAHPEDRTKHVLDRYFDHARFSFKADCPSTLDCEPPPHACPPGEDRNPPIDYRAKDFDSFKQALLEYSALRYPSWQERSEADFGVMFAEALSSLADDLSYQQDRIAAEGWLETATERRSLVRLARLVDYEPRVQAAARVDLCFEMEQPGQIPPGTAVGALSPDGALIEFETGDDLSDRILRDVDPAWNAMTAWWFDDAERCLPRGATAMWIQRPARPLVDGQRLVIETARESTADPPLRQLVTLAGNQIEDVDPLYGVPLLQLRWRDDDALVAERDLKWTVARGNLVPATHGTRRVEPFVISHARPTLSDPPHAVIRTGPNGGSQYLYSLATSPLAWLDPGEANEEPRPEIAVVETSRGADTWEWQRSLLRARPFDKAFTLDPMRYRALDLQRTFYEYDGDDGETIRFGDGSFGLIPDAGMTFEVTYRAGGGISGNVAAGALTRIDGATRARLGIASVTNPFPASGGRDAEPDAHVRELAPQKFRARPLRAVRTDDYEAAASSLGWVQRAGSRFRYTGSWLSVFTSVDPRSSETISDQRMLELVRLLDRRRLAGYETFALPPRFASLDLEIQICVRPDAFRSDVHEALLVALDASLHLDGTRGYFHPDAFTFGVPLERSTLEAAIQRVHGVDGVVSIRYRRRGHTPGFVTMPDAVEVAVDEIVRVDNNPNRPERGSLRLDLRGGK